ncbi:MAG: glycosyltransferase family 4 protein [Gammaproteobacteria bacterium]|nr:hypothetical protein [Gammaproteobacteria bacterium]
MLKVPTVLVVTGRSDRSEASLLVALHRAGLCLTVLGRADSAYRERFEHAGIDHVPLMLLGGRDRSGIEVIRWHLDALRPAILHLVGRDAIANGLRAAKGRKSKIVLQRRVIGDAAAIGFFDWAAFVRPGVDRVVCGAETVRRAMLERGFGPFRVPAEKLVTIYAGHELDWYRAEPLDLAVVGVPGDAFVVAAIADSRPELTVAWLARAAEHLPAGLPIHFLLLGRGVSRPATLRLVRRSPYRDRFHVLGFREDASRILAASDAMVRRAGRAEGVPRSTVEAMVYRTVPIVSRDSGSAELVEHERSGLVVPGGDGRALADALLRLYRDRTFCAELGRNARRRIASVFTVEKSAAQVERMYRELISGP